MFIIVFLCVNYLIVKVQTHHEEKTFCPKVDNCNSNWIYPYYLTKDLKCTHNNQCPIGSLCCSDCNYYHKVCKIPVWLPKNKIKIECPNSTIYCRQKFPYLGTKQHKCELDSDCTLESLCCHDDCYTHKICKKADMQDSEIECPIDFKLCNSPLAFEKTKKYQCISSRQCKKKYACCSDSCYEHKICKFKLQQEKNQLCPESIRKEYCTNTNRTLLRYSCKNNNNCHDGYVCCEDNCYDHNVCKLADDGFSYKSIYKKSDFPIFNFETLQKHNCPNIEAKCTKPYSLRLAKKFICFKDDDCKIGQMCCKDACIKDFKICKNIFNLPQNNSTLKSDIVDETHKENIKKITSENANEKEYSENIKNKISSYSELDKQFYFDEMDQFKLLLSNYTEEGSGSGDSINDGED